MVDGEEIDDGGDWSGVPPANNTLQLSKGRRLTLLEIVLCNSGTAVVGSGWNRSLSCSGEEEQRER